MQQVTAESLLAPAVDFWLTSIEQHPWPFIGILIFFLLMAMSGNGPRPRRRRRSKPWKRSAPIAQVKKRPIELRLSTCVLVAGSAATIAILRRPDGSLLEASLGFLALVSGLLLVTTCLSSLLRASMIGRRGERKVRHALALLDLPTLHDVVLADRFGHTQIDHLVRTQHGIAVLETKTLAGFVTGTVSGALWIQHLAGGRVRHSFQNPMRQNYRHRMAVEAAIADPGVTVTDHVVSAGEARFCAEIGASILSLATLHTFDQTGRRPAAGAGAVKLDHAWNTLGKLAGRSSRLRRAHRREVARWRSPRQALTRRLALGLLPVGVITALSGLALVAAPRSASAASTVPACEAVQLSLLLEDGQSGLGGVSDHAALLVVRNHGMTACRIPGLPPVTFQDAGGHVLPIVRQIPPGMHPGPAVLPAFVPAGGSVDARLGWISDGTRMGGRCYSPAGIEIAIGEQAIGHPFQGHLCAAPGQPAKFMQGWFRSGSGQEMPR